MATYYIKEEDTTPQLQATLKDSDGSAVDLTNTNVSIYIAEARGGENIVNSDARIEDAANGVVSYKLSSPETENNGRYRVEWEVDYGGNGLETFPNKGYHTLMIGRNMEV